MLTPEKEEKKEKKEPELNFLFSNAQIKEYEKKHFIYLNYQYSQFTDQFIRNFSKSEEAKSIKAFI